MSEVLDYRLAAVSEDTDLRAEATRPHRRGWLVRRALLAADVIGLAIGFVVAEALAVGNSTGGLLQHPAEFGVAVALLPLWVFAAKLAGLYDRDEARTDHSTIDEFVSVFLLITVFAWVFLLASWQTHLANPELSKLSLFWAIAKVSVTVSRAFARTICRHHISYLQNTIVVGAGDVGQLIARKLLQHPEYGINLVGFVDADPKERREGLEHIALLGTTDQLPELCQLLDVERVVVAFSRQEAQDSLEVVRSLRNLDIQIDVVPRLFEVLGPCASVHSVEGLPLVGLPPVRLTPSWRLMKRTLDLVTASVLLLLTWPLFLIVGLAVRLGSEGPVLFRQRRLGFEMKEFTTLKFRTMYVGVDQEQHRDYIRQTMNRSTAPVGDGHYKLSREGEITKVGRFLRKTSLDELPQLLNVLKGDMSLVGPRPCIAYETEFFEPHHFERFLVPQGLTGLWQVTARTRSTFAEALDMDVAYARNWSFDLDLRLLFKTPLQLVRLRGSA